MADLPTSAGSQRTPFEDLVEDYDAARPEYPPALFDAVEHLVGPLDDHRVFEVGAGTGIATRGLLARGARVFACDLGERMLRRNVERTPGLPAVLGDAHALPFATASADAVVYAQAWHWVDVASAALSAHRVLRSDGALLLWWNEVDATGLPWFEAQQDRLEAHSPGYRRGYRDRPYAEELTATGAFRAAESVELQWTRTLDLDTYLAWLRSKSYVAALGPARGDFLEAERASLTAAFPAGEIVEPFRVRVIVARPLGR